MYLLTALGVTVGFHRLLTHRAFQTVPLAALHARDARLDVAAGPGDRLGRRPPQAPHLHRRRGRPAQPPRRPRRGAARDAARALARARRLAVRDPRPGLLATLRAATWSRTRTMRRINRALPADRAGEPAVPFLLGLAISGGSLVAGGLSALLWAGLVRIFLVHHVTWSINSICHFFGGGASTPTTSRQRLLAGAALAGRGLAPQPPRLPAVGLPRAALVRARPLRAG